MAKKFLVDLDLSTNELQNAVIQNLPVASEPTGIKGRLYFDETNNILKVYNGSLWQSLATGGSTVDTLIINGDVTGSATAVGSTITVSTTIAANSVALGTDTTGNYVASLTASTGVNVTGTAGEGWSPVISIGQPVATSDSPTFSALTITNDLAVNGADITTTSTGTATLFNANATTLNIGGAATTIGIGAATGTTTVNNNLTVTGDLLVSGSVTTLNTATLFVEDNVIILNSNVTSGPTLDAGVEIERGTSLNVSLLWNETSDLWTLTNDGTNFFEIAKKYSTTITANSSSTSFPITHNLGTRDVTVNVYTNSGNYDTVEVDIYRNSTNAVTIGFANAPTTGTDYRVVIVG